MVLLQSVQVRSVRRLRLTFDTALAAGAFAPSWYAVRSLDGRSGDPYIAAVFAVSGIASEAELALGSDLAEGGEYALDLLTGLPAADLTTLLNSSASFLVPTPPRAPSQGFTAADLSDLIFRVDLLRDGGRFIEAPDGDIATIGGVENVKRSSVRRALSDGLPHDGDYGGHLRAVVDAPASVLPASRARLEQQMGQDDRVVEATVSITQNANDGDVTLALDIGLIGGIRTQAEARV